MSKPIALAFSDIHLNMWSKFNDNKERTKNHFKVLSLIMEACETHRVGTVLFGGDFFHKPENIDSELFELSSELISNKLNKWDKDIIGISGNHDMKFNNTQSKPSPSLFKSICKLSQSLHCIDFGSRNIGSATVHGVPYLDRNLGLNEYVSGIKLAKNKNILLLHTDYPGAKDTDGSVVDSVENLNLNLLNRFDLVLIGHIHKHQRLSKKVYIIGATHQQRRTDRESDMGYIIIYDDMTVKQISLSNKLPRFIDVEDSEQIKDDGNYYTVIGKSMPKTDDKPSNDINIGLSRRKLVRKYLKANGIVDKDKKKLLVNILERVGND